MKSTMAWTAIALVGLTGCNGPGSVSGGGGQAHGRYASAGTYPAGRMWSQAIGAPTSKDASTAKLSDDDQIIVVFDSQTGEVRQCGNISGYCVGMNPWAKPAGASTPLAVAKHSDQLDAEAKAELEALTKGKPVELPSGR